MKSVSRLASLALVAALVLSGCGDDGDDAKEPSSSGAGGSSGSSGDSSTGSDSTDGGGTPGPGDELALGEVAPLSWQPKENLQGEVEVSVDRVDQASIKDFAAFRLDRAVRQSTPYYVHVTVRNTGSTNLAGVELPIFLDNGSDVLFPSARIKAAFKPCPFEPLPPKFTQGKRATLCLVFLAASKTKLEAVAMRPTEQTEPITWTGEITKPAKPKKKSKKG